MNKKLITLLKNEKVKGGEMLDLYNQKVIRNGISCTITTRVSASNEIFLVENDEQG